MPLIKVLLVDDHELFRDGVEMLLSLEDHIRLAASLPNGRLLLEYLKTHEMPDVFILDINLPGVSGIELARQLISQYGKLNIIFLTSNKAKSFMDAALRVGGRGFITKECTKEELVDALETVNSGQLYLGKGMAQFAYQGYVHHLTADDQAAKLTERELQVLQDFANGLTYQEVADKLGIAKKTVEGHKKTIYEKLSLKNQTDLVKYAIRYHIVEC